MGTKIRGTFDIQINTQAWKIHTFSQSMTHLNASFSVFRVTPAPTFTKQSSPTSPMDWKLHMSRLMPPFLWIRTVLYICVLLLLDKHDDGIWTTSPEFLLGPSLHSVGGRNCKCPSNEVPSIDRLIFDIATEDIDSLRTRKALLSLKRAQPTKRMRTCSIWNNRYNFHSW